MSGVKPQLIAGSVLGDRYVIVSLIGSGGMGNVYLAEDRKLPGKRWAVKETRHEGTVDRFIHEARILTALAHPNLPHIFDFIAPDRNGYGYIVMEYIEGETLAAKFKRLGGRMDADEVRRIGMQICDIFEYLHREAARFPIIYRDLKPSNIMVNGGGHVKLIDFGIAKRLDREGPDDTVQMGTFGFAAPEQYGGKTDERTDLYNLGALLYYLLSGGKYAIPGEPLNDFAAGADKPLCDVVARLLAPNASQRYPSAAAAKEALAASSAREMRADAVRSEQHDGQRHAGPEKVIAVCGLYRGCGATFASFALAFALRAAGESCALLEFPKGEPDHKVWVQGNPKRGKESGGTFIDFAGIACYPAHLLGGGAEGRPSVEDMLRRLQTVRERVAVIDVSTLWDDEAVRDWVVQADALWIVADSNIVQWSRAETEKRLRLAVRWSNEGRRVCWLANRDGRFQARKRWLAAFPCSPEVYLPSLHGERIADAFWGDEADRKLQACLADVQPFLRKAIKKILSK